MKIAYLILAHNSPNHLYTLVKALSTTHAKIFIHLDQKSDMQSFAHLHELGVHFIEERIPVYWGDFSMVEATLALIKSAFAYSNDFSRFVLVSGVDYPIYPIEKIEAFFEQNKNAEFINLIPMPSDIAGKPISRLLNYVYRPQGNRFFQKFRKALVKLHVIPRQRDYLSALGKTVPYGGSNWWALTRDACEYILQFAKREKKINEFFKNTENPDESYFNTIIGNSKFRLKAVGGITYTDWSKGGANPAIISMEHLKKFKSIDGPIIADDFYGKRELMFARKFPENSKELVDYLSERHSMT